MRKWTIGTALILSLAGCASDTDTSAPAATTPAAQTAPPVRGVAPTPAQAAAYRAELQKLLARSSNRAAIRNTAGVRSAHVDGLGNVALARYGADGKLDQACLDNVDAAMDFLTEVDGNGLEVK